MALNEDPDELMLYTTEWKPMFAQVGTIAKDGDMHESASIASIIELS